MRIACFGCVDDANTGTAGVDRVEGVMDIEVGRSRRMRVLLPRLIISVALL